MIYTEHIFICLAAPLLAGVLFLRQGERRYLCFFLLGLFVCLLAAYMNGFLGAMAGMTIDEAMIRLTPICEEIMKALPVLIYLMVFIPEDRAVFSAAVLTGLGFATMENVCLITQYGMSTLPFVLVRGFSAGMMHAVCAVLLGYGLSFVRRSQHLLMPGAFSLLCITSIFHSVYNLLVHVEGAWRMAGYALPAATAAIVYVFTINRGKKHQRPSSRRADKDVRQGRADRA